MGSNAAILSEAKNFLPYSFTSNKLRHDLSKLLYRFGEIAGCNLRGFSVLY